MKAVADVFRVGIARRNSLFPVHAAIPPVLDSVVTSVTEPSRDLSPSFPHFLYKLFDHFAFLSGDRLMVQAWLEVLMISLTTLLRRAVL